MNDIETKFKDGVLSFNFELHESISETIYGIWEQHGGEGRFMVICQPVERDGAWRLHGRILNPEHFNTISKVIDGETERQRYNYRSQLKFGCGGK